MWYKLVVQNHWKGTIFSTIWNITQVKHLLFLISFYLLIFPIFGETSKPNVFVIHPIIKGEIPPIQIKFLQITLSDTLSINFNVSSPPQNNSGVCLSGCNFFQIEISKKDEITIMSLKWKNKDFRKIESTHCVRCNTTELNEKLKYLIDNLVLAQEHKNNHALLGPLIYL